MSKKYIYLKSTIDEQKKQWFGKPSKVCWLPARNATHMRCRRAHLPARLLQRRMNLERGDVRMSIVKK